jgi:SNF2 family DNA or RNA helicase
MKEIEIAFKISDYEGWQKASLKIQYLFELMDNLYKEGHKLLIFSKTKILLNMVEEIVRYWFDL